ncbi:hypothetical protein Q3O97_15235 [Ralstonia pseudosolanacearum]|uniref:hypothetical protein n=1 Tax=Ralstonia pseudosolanacearum TaxID=1310165 RepID=UPI0026F5148F|nr:hypothetical protein [Ralstonia pseudosolanacearum]MDO3617204.1 hypothetical protein [Ralstonia pseudosolanacearum]
MRLRGLSEASMVDYLFIALYVLATAYSAVFVNVKFHDASANLIMFSTFLVCWGVFLALNRRRLGVLLSVVRASPGNVFAINLSTLLSWLGMFWCLKFVSASVESLIYMSIIPLVSMIVGRQWGDAGPAGRVGVLTIAVAALLVAYQNPSMHEIAADGQMVGVLLALGAGACGGVYIVASSRAQRKHALTANDLICIRLPLLLLATAALSAPEWHKFGSADFLQKAVLLSATAVMIPSYMLQQSIIRLGGVRTSVLVPFVPVLAMALELREGFEFNLRAGLLLGLQCAAMMYVSVLLARRKDELARVTAGSKTGVAMR